MTTKDVLALALESLENHDGNYAQSNASAARVNAAITAIKQAQEPVESEYKRGFSDGMNEAPTGDCWVRAVDEAMVGAHLGVADMADDYGTAKKKLNDLICWHVEVAQEPAPKQAEPFNPDWSLLDATQESLREHMQMVKQAEPAWQPIESAPKDGSEILLGHKDGSLAIGWWRARNPNQGWTDGDSYAMGWPTHWQPAPTPPEAA